MPPIPSTNFHTLDRKAVQPTPPSFSLQNLADPDFRINDKIARLVYRNHAEFTTVNSKTGKKFRPPLSIDLIELTLDALAFFATFGWTSERPSPLVGRPSVGSINDVSGLATTSNGLDNTLAGFAAARIVVAALNAADMRLGPTISMGMANYLVKKAGADLDVEVQADEHENFVFDESSDVMGLTAFFQPHNPYPLVIVSSEECPVAIDLFMGNWRRSYATRAHELTVATSPDIGIDSISLRPGVIATKYLFNAISTGAFYQNFYNSLTLVQLADIFVVSRVAAHLQRNDPERAPTTTFADRLKRLQQAWTHHRHTDLILDDNNQRLSSNSPDVADFRGDFPIAIDEFMSLPQMPPKDF